MSEQTPVELAGLADTLQAINECKSEARAPTSGVDDVYKTECAFSFHTPESQGGLYTSLKSWVSFSTEYIDMYQKKFGHRLFLHQAWTRVAKPGTSTEDDTPAIAVDDDGALIVHGLGIKWQHEKQYKLVLFPERKEVPYPCQGIDPELALVVDSIIHHEPAKGDNFSGFKDEIKVSKYADELPFVDNGKKISPNPADWKCECGCGATENLWLNLSDGHIGGGRKAAYGMGGCGAALDNFEATGSKYPLVVKLGTITVAGGDVYSYAPDENNSVLDPKLGEHLAARGIDIMSMKKTEKSTAERQVDLNLNHEWSSITEDGSKLVPLKGPGFVGLKNTGNSCYINSLLQVLFALPPFRKRYLDAAQEVFKRAPSNPANDFNTQMSKLAIALLTEKYVDEKSPAIVGLDEKEQQKARENSDEPDMINIAPHMLRQVIGKGHIDFSTKEQQDVHEYYQHVIARIERAERSAGTPFDITKLFTFAFEDRLEDDQSHKVRYSTIDGQNCLSLNIPLTPEEEKLIQNPPKPSDDEVVEPIKIPFDRCIGAFTADTKIDGFVSPVTEQKGTATKRSRLATFPPYVMIQMRRYIAGANWVPMKITASIPVPEELDLSFLRGTGLQSNEEEMPSASGAGAGAFEPDVTIVSQIVAMGFSENGAIRACKATNNADADTALNWVFAHMSDADFNDPLSSGGDASGAADVNAESLMMLVSMGFPEKHAVKALKATDGDVARASDWLFSRAGTLDDDANDGDDAKQATGAAFLDGNGMYDLVGFMSHGGPNVGSGHYVCHIKKNGEWAIFDDRKVAKSEKPPLDIGYMYCFKRRDFDADTVQF
jgi:ubiquitin carboxyl-terminal hydrolase 5/13